ncbi:MAG: bacillithiol biosynthesis cysteine-adding enzyme BshC [Bacteroidetes bacterium]|nr:bacillithiol biosynthesis cysteine-adding enzyme BshC [Bacteroidota bacterium]
MKVTATYLPYSHTKAFSSITADYLAGEQSLRKFYAHEPGIAGIQQAIQQRKKYQCNRTVLVDELNKQYATVDAHEKVRSNIDLLLQDNCYTICTAHQPNIFTGHLYFVFKIIHAIKLADLLNEQVKDCCFVPVYYMGSEDADLEELGEVFINGKKYQWETKQKGAVGRMKIDKAFIEMIAAIEAQLSVELYGKEILALVKQCYTVGKTVQQATFEFVHALFADKGLIILLPDNAVLKSEFSNVVAKELEEQFSQKAVNETIAALPGKYKVQVAGREINLFYLKDDIRERIEQTPSGFTIANTSLHFTREELFTELKNYPERFSPNVILRPVFQEMILPNVVFIGGGGELAYWLELKQVFEAAAVPFPVIVLRNSFLVVNKKNAALMEKLGLDKNEIFNSEQQLVNTFVSKHSQQQLQLNKESVQLEKLYNGIVQVASAVDKSLERHVQALFIQSQKKIAILEKKILKAEKLKFEAAQRQISKLKSALFPGGTLQERIDNLLPYYAVWGKAFMEMLYEHSLGMEQEFCVVEEKQGM